MIEMAVIADDITGAADTGVQFLRAFAPVYLLDHRSLSLKIFDDPPQGVSVYTNSRGLTSEGATQAVSTASRALRALNPQRVYKKIDSALRGHIGPELETAMEVLGAPWSFIAPAFPGENRTTVDGIHRINGVPVAETEIGRDPVAPVTESFLPKWIGSQTRWFVAHISLETIDAGLEAIAEEITSLRSRGARHVIFDATQARHLDCIARLALEYFPDALLCGSAGLARSLAVQLPRRRTFGVNRQETGVPIRAGNLLFVCGSASQKLRLQVAELALHANVAVETIAPASLVGDDERTAKVATLDRAVAALSERDLVLQLSAPGVEPTAIDAQRLAVKLSELAVTLINLVKPAGLFLSGGDTAIAVLERLQARAIRLEKEIPGGLVYGIILGGLMSGCPVITKAGSFGKPDTLLNLYRAIKQPISFK